MVVDEALEAHRAADQRVGMGAPGIVIVDVDQALGQAPDGRDRRAQLVTDHVHDATTEQVEVLGGGHCRQCSDARLRSNPWTYASV